jgi:dihydroxyacetone kinase-like predicted kinase
VGENAFVRKKPEKRSKFAFVTVSAGSGLSKIFEDLGVANIIQGGQTMNPSTQDFLDEIAVINADVIYLLPNNKNIILAANQAKEMSDEHIEVIPTKTIPQGISAILAFDENADSDESLKNMEAAVKNIKTGQVTFSVRDTNIGSKTIKKGNIIGISDKDGIVTVTTSPEKTAIELIQSMTDESTELIYIYYGEDVEEKDAQKLHKKLEKLYGNIDVVLQYGGQPLYYYIVSVE